MTTFQLSSLAPSSTLSTLSTLLFPGRKLFTAPYHLQNTVRMSYSGVLGLCLSFYFFPPCVPEVESGTSKGNLHILQQRMH